MFLPGIFTPPETTDLQKSGPRDSQEREQETVACCLLPVPFFGEMIRQLTPKGVNVPTGFATTAYADRYFIEQAGLDTQR